PWLAFSMMLAMFSLAGIPPFAGFFSKFFIFVGACHTGSVAIYVLVLIALINTIISLYYYLLVVKAMFIKQDECVIPTFKVACSEKLALIITTLGIILIGLASCIYTYLAEAASNSSAMFMFIH
ncbi:MAG: proton-conducting transporter membrane subunit, partial [Muribaculaceae bacterium]